MSTTCNKEQLYYYKAIRSGARSVNGHGEVGEAFNKNANQ